MEVQGIIIIRLEKLKEEKFHNARISPSRPENKWGESLLTEQTQQCRDNHFNNLKKHVSFDQYWATIFLLGPIQ